MQPTLCPGFKVTCGLEVSVKKEAKSRVSDV